MYQSYRRNSRFSDELKQTICQRILCGELTIAEARREYNIRGAGNVYKWMRKFGYEPEAPSSMSQEPDPLPEDPSLLKIRITELERQLEAERFKNIAVNKMIDIADTELNVDIRKKSFTKQSKS